MTSDHGSLDYRGAGVDIDAGDALVRAIQTSVAATHGPEVLRGLGHFGGFYRIGETGAGTTLVASADGVGTKLKVAVLAGLHDHIGEDIVNHCINDILACGAKPLFFLDYFATGSLDADVASRVINGIARACKVRVSLCLVGKPPKCRGFTPKATMTWRVLLSALLKKTRSSMGRQWTQATSSSAFRRRISY